MDFAKDDFYKNLLDQLEEGVYFVDLDRTIIYWNKAAEHITGYPAQAVLGKRCADNILCHVNDTGTNLCLTDCPLAATIEDGRTREINVYLHHKNGHRVPVTVRSTPYRNEDGETVGAIEIFSDNSKRIDIIHQLEKLKQEVLTDPLTQVGNRKLADMELTRRQAEAHSMDLPYGILFVDIDHFKSVNDTCGHAEGDRVLTMVANTMGGALRPLDVLCRWGGEEFVTILPNLDIETLEKVAERIRMLVESTWVDPKGHEPLQVTVSVGGALSRPDEGYETVIQRADQAMYACKQGGRNRVRVLP